MRFEVGARVVYKAVCSNSARNTEYEGKIGVVEACRTLSRYPMCGCSYRVTIRLSDGQLKNFHDKNLRIANTHQNRAAESPPTASAYLTDTQSVGVSGTISHGVHPFYMWYSNPCSEINISGRSIMLGSNTVRTKAGHVGHVVNQRNNEILWESEPFTDDPEGTENGKTGQAKALKAAEDAINTGLERLFTA